MGTLALPAYGTLVDVFHENKPQGVLVIETTGSPTRLTLIVWDNVATTDQRALTNLYGRYGFPISGPTSGRQFINFDTQQFVGSPHLTGLGNKSYTVTVDVTGPGSPNSVTQQTVSISGQTFPQLAAALTSALTDVDVFWTGKTIRFATIAVGSNAKVEVGRFDTLFNPASPLVGFAGFGESLIGVSSTRDVLELNRTDANVLFSDRYRFIVRNRHPHLNTAFNLRTEYFDSGALGDRVIGGSGSPLSNPAVWRLLGTNALSGSPDTTPSWLLT